MTEEERVGYLKEWDIFDSLRDCHGWFDAVNEYTWDLLPDNQLKEMDRLSERLDEIREDAIEFRNRSVRELKQ